VGRREGVVEYEMLEHCVRDLLNRTALRRMAVLRPLKVVLTNYPEGQVEEFDAVNNPEDAGAGSRKVKFSRELFVEREDFMEDPPKKFFRLSPGREVRLPGEIVEVRCTYDPESRGGSAPDGRSPKATLHWVSAPHAVTGEVRIYNHLFSRPDPGADRDLLLDLSPESEEVVTGCRLEPALAGLPAGTVVQFERLGYFCVDRDSTGALPVFNRTVTLRDTWAKVQAKGKG